MEADTSRLAVLALASITAIASPATASDPILEIHNDSLTTYQHASATGVQDIRPMLAHRGVNLDGSLRARPGHAMELAGNPFGAVGQASRVSGVRLDTGQFVVDDVDISLPAPGFRWNIGRSYNARQETSGSAHRDSDGYQGKNWFQSSQPEIVLFEAAADEDDLVYLIYGADRFVEFKRASSSSDTFKAKNGAAGIFFFVDGGGGPDTYTYYDQRGNEFWFFGFDGDASPAEGQLWKIVDPAANTAYVGDATTASTAISDGFDSGGRIEKAYDAADRRYTYTYTTLDGVDRLTEVKAETKTGGTWASPTGLATVAEVDYEYYTDESYGDEGDLKLVEITIPMSDSGVEVVKKKYYRYWEGSYNVSTNPGYPHALKLVVDFEGARQYDWQDSTFDEDFLTASHANLEPYASGYFEYDTSHRINEAFFNGECGCSGAATGTHLFSYASNGSYSDGSGYDTAWLTRTVVEQPDGSYLTQYFDEVYQGLSSILSDDDPSNTSPQPDMWITGVVRVIPGVPTKVYTPASVTGYTHSTGAVTVSSSDGLVWTYTYLTTGETKGFREHVKWSEGSSGTKYFHGTNEYSTAALTDASWDKDVVRPSISKTIDYSERITSGSSGTEERAISTSEHSGLIAPSDVTTTLPSVSTSENGSGSSETAKVYFEEDGTVTFEKSEAGIITYRALTNGQVTTLVEDADTDDAEITTEPTGFTSSGTELHQKTTYTYDAQGRLETTTLPTGRVTKNYYSKLADGRLVTLSYPKYDSGAGKFYGPVSYTVENHAGEVEIQATVGLTNNETTTAVTGHIDESDDDPITAADLGSVEMMTANVWNETGLRLEESRLYHDVPASGDGSDGTNYDPTLRGYDDMGRLTRLVAPHGTIQRRVYDAAGRVVEIHIGTNDADFDGGSSSGTDNMVETAAAEYDGGSDSGNGYLTKLTLFVEDSATDKRETSFTNDLFGRTLVEDRPETPHLFHRYDNKGQRTATGLFSSTASIDADSDDPTTETANRVALVQAFYDANGRIWKTQRHKIDLDDGSDDDNLTAEHWFDAEGRLVKSDAEHLVKRSYDRLGRETHEFTLASDNDTGYADADDVTGDIVLEERQKIHDDGLIVLEAYVERYHDDYGGGETTGSLDTNSDGDDLKYTASDLEGRIQITAHWYDAMDRLEETVRCGTYGGSTFDRDGMSVPARSDTDLRTTRVYANAGQRQSEEDPLGVVTRSEYDAAGRLTKVIRNYDASVNSGNPSGSDDNVTVKYEYTDGLRTKVIADLPSGATDQETEFTYGTTKGASAGDSKIETGHLLQEIKYPDSASASDVVTFAYNAQGQRIYRKDQAGNVIEYDYDGVGRETAEKVTTLASGFNGDVRRIATSYTDVGQRELVTQYDAATSGSVVNEAKFTWGDWGPLEKLEQDKNSAVGASGSVDDYQVEYRWSKATSGRNTLRIDRFTLPSGNELTYEYLSANSLHDDESSRVTRIKDGAVVLVKYAQNGFGSTVATDYPEAEIHWELFGATSGEYPDLDRFNRVVAMQWTKDLGTDIDVYDIDITYDRDSRITLVEDHVLAGSDASFDLDDLGRVVDADYGTWNGSTITSRSRRCEWTLDHVGNWDLGKRDLNGDGDWSDAGEFQDDRTWNDANELTGRDIDDNGTDDYTLTYDAVGNLTDDGSDYEYEYDAFGRLTEVTDQSSNLVVEYAYNGLGHRIGEHADADEDGDVDSSDAWFWSVFTPDWQCVAAYRADDSDPKIEWVHQVAPVKRTVDLDRLVCRYRDANTAWNSAADGTLEERVYFGQNWRGDLVLLVNNDGSELVERTQYLAYGTSLFLAPGDVDGDGTVEDEDVDAVQAWIAVSAYDVRGDVDLDGDVDADDKSTISSDHLGKSGTWGGQSHVRNGRGLSGHNATAHGLVDARGRSLVQQLGRWLTRDRIEYVHLEGPNLYQYVQSGPVIRIDPMGLQGQIVLRASPMKPFYLRPLGDPPDPPEDPPTVIVDEFSGINGPCYRAHSPSLTTSLGGGWDIGVTGTVCTNVDGVEMIAVGLSAWLNE